MKRHKRLQLLVVVIVVLVTTGIFIGVSQLQHATQTFYPETAVAEGNFPSAPVWIFEADSQVISTPLIIDNTIVIRTSETIYALDGFSGTNLWQTSISGYAPNDIPPVGNQEYILASNDLSLTVLSTQNGQVVWEQDKSKLSQQFHYVPGTSTIDSIAITDLAAFAARLSWNITGYDLGSGKTRWVTEAPDRSCLWLAASEDTVYLGADKSVSANDTTTGNLLWQENLGGGAVGPVLLDEDRLFVVVSLTNGKALVAFDTITRRPLWRVNLPESQTLCRSYITQDKDVLYAAGAEILSAISVTTGEILWQMELVDLHGKPVVLKDKVFIRSDGPILYELDSKSGLKIGSLSIEANLPIAFRERGIAAYNDLLIVPFGDNRVYAYMP